MHSFGFAVVGASAFLFSECRHWAFCAFVELVAESRVLPGLSECASRKSRFEAFRASIDCFRVLILCVLFS